MNMKNPYLPSRYVFSLKNFYSSKNPFAPFSVYRGKFISNLLNSRILTWKKIGVLHCKRFACHAHEKNSYLVAGETKENFKGNVKDLFSLHLLELRYRATYFLLSFSGTFFMGTQESTPLTHLLCTPFSSKGDECSQFIFTQVTEGFYATLEVSFICALCFCVPLMAYHLYCFFIPSCYQGERQKINLVFFFVLLFFLCSLFVAYALVLPKICAFLRQFQYESRCMEIKLEARIAPAIRWSCTTFLVTAAFFQAPILFILLLKWGLIKDSFLGEKRKYALFSLLLILSLISPPDVTSQCVLATMGCVVYESFFWSALFYHRWYAKSCTLSSRKKDISPHALRLP